MRHHGKLISLVVVLVLTGCNNPGPHFRYLPATRVTVADATFDVRVNQHLAEAIRINSQYAPRLGPIPVEAADAMRLVSGCRVTEILGDAAQLTGVLDCGAGPPPIILVTGFNYECITVDSYISSADDNLIADYDCEAVPY